MLAEELGEDGAPGGEGAAVDPELRDAFTRLGPTGVTRVTGTVAEGVDLVTLERGGQPDGLGIRNKDGVVTPLHMVGEPRAEYQPGATPLPEVPPAFPEGTGLVPSAFPLQGTLAAFHNAQEGGWPRDAQGQPYYPFVQPQGTVYVTLGAPVGEPEPIGAAAREALWAQFKGLGDLDADVLLAGLVQWIRSRDADGYSWITGPAVLDYRGIRPRMQPDQPDGKRYRAGHRADDLAAVAACFERLRLVYLDLVNVEIREPPRGRRKPRLTRYSLKTELLHVPNILTQRHLDGREHRVAWQYRPGQWLGRYLEPPNEQLALLMQTTLRYDPYRERWEKRLAKYFLFHLRIGAKGGASPLRRNVGAVVWELGLAEAFDRRNPERTAKRFEGAMDRLRDDGHIGGWGFTDESRRWWARRPARGWLEAWFGVDGRGGVATMLVTPAAAAVAQYRRLARHARSTTTRP
jgi:hypothetical protein